MKMSELTIGKYYASEWLPGHGAIMKCTNVPPKSQDTHSNYKHKNRLLMFSSNKLKGKGQGGNATNNVWREATEDEIARYNIAASLNPLYNVFN